MFDVHKISGRHFYLNTILINILLSYFSQAKSTTRKFAHKKAIVLTKIL
jgi:hypothetical protein